jgi:hypothetical protein
VLKAHGDERAGAILQAAHDDLQRRAANIGDEALHPSFLENVPWHREILREWAEMAGHARDR